MAAHGLVAWLYGVPVATIREVRTHKLDLRYRAEAEDRWRFGEAVLSVALPLSRDRYPNGKVEPFLDGLLPEGEARTTLERTFGIRRGDTFAFLAALGHDCAGAVVFQMEGVDPPSLPANEPAMLSDDDLYEDVDALVLRPLGDDPHRDIRLSLAGQQSKLLLTRTVDGRWARPTGGLPSTHILKPEDTRLPGLVANEAFCLRLARQLGLTTITVDQIDARGRPVLVVSRYDRRTNRHGTIERLHQEDLCQALSLPATDRTKYEAEGGPSLRDLANVLDTWSSDPSSDLARLSGALALQVVIGNADAHGKNYSLLHHPEHGTYLAPLYDLSSTIQYPTIETPEGRQRVSSDLAMSINGKRDIDAVTFDDLVQEGRSWQVSEGRVREQLSSVIDRLPAAIDNAAGETPGVSEQLVDTVRERAAELRDGHPVRGALR